MGYSYSNVFENEHEVKIANSLLMMLRGENCASTTQMVDFIESGRFQILCSDDEEKTLRYVDEEGKTMLLSFPGILNLKGSYSQIQYSRSEGIGEIVIFFSFLY